MTSSNGSAAPDTVVPAPYGQACESCTRSKTKCLLLRNDTSCTRCRRLRRDCRPVATRRRRQITSRQITPDGGLPLLGAGHSTARVNTTLAAPQIGRSSPSIEPPSWCTGIRTTDAVLDLSIAEADACLATFRSFAFGYFPFIEFSPHTSAQQLQEERPFLWLNIVAITAQSSSRQQRLGALIRQHVAQNMVIETERSIDLLLGLLAFLAWYSYLTDANTQSSLSVFSQLTISLVYDLGLHKVHTLQLLPITSKAADSARERTTEERRAVLACFLITSSISHFIQRTEPLKWTPHLADCLDELVAVPNCSAGDELLAFLVRCQVVIENAADAFNSVDRTPSSIYFQALHAQIENCRILMPLSTDAKAVASMHLITTEIIIAQMAFSHCSTDGPGNDVERVKYLYSCTESIKAWFEVYFTISANQHYGLPFSVTSQIVRCLQLLYHLSTLNDSAWNCSDVRSSIDILATMDHVIDKIRQVPTLVSLTSSDGSDEDVFSRSAHQFASLRASWATALNHGVGPSSDMTPPDTFGSAEFGATADWEIPWPIGDWWAEFMVPQQY